MKGVVLAGGTGSRLFPLTKVTNKHLLPVWDKPMIFYPLNTLISMGIDDIMIVSSNEHCGHVLQLLGSGRDFGARFSYEIQDKVGGIAHALGLAEKFANKENVAVILGDNIFEDKFDISSFSSGAKLFLKEVENSERFGVAEIQDNKLINIEEKPKEPKSRLAVTGLYAYDNNVFDIIKTLNPSGRGELEITDVNNAYLKKGLVDYSFVMGSWTDAGTFESLYRANSIAKRISSKNE